MPPQVVLLLLLSTALDYLTGPQITAAAFYVFPVALAGWKMGSAWGLASAFAAVGLNLALEWTWTPHSSTVFIANAILRLILFSMVGWISDVAGRQQRLALEQRDQLEQISQRDPLTHLFNRRGMDRLFQEEMDRYKRYEHPFSLILIDVDHFKTLNDTYGHQVGDELLQWVAVRIQASVRSIDRAIRYGGDEFAILLPDTTQEGVGAIAERVRETVGADNFNFRDEAGEQIMIPLTLSIGTASLPQHADHMNGLVEAADQALCKAKRLGRNRVVHYS